MSQTIGNARLGIQNWIGRDAVLIQGIPTIYHHFRIDFCPVIIIQGEEELTDEEILSLPEKIGMFNFLHDSCEDIYTENDGEPLE